MFEQLLIFLNAPNGESKADARRMPWVAERLLLYMLRDSPELYGNELATKSTVAEAMNRCWRNVNAVFKGNIEIESFPLFIRSVFIAQAPDQTDLNPVAFARQLLLCESLEANSKLAWLLSEKARVPLEKFFELAILAWIKTRDDQPWFSQEYLQKLAETYEAVDIDRFFGAFSLSLSDLQVHFRNTAGSISVDEWFQPSVFYRSPCVRQHKAIVPLGRPTLRRYLETFVADTVDQSDDQQIRQVWEKRVERYVLETASRLGAEVLNEAGMRSRFALQTGLCCDVALIFPNAIVCIEVKTKNLNSRLPAAASVRDMKAKLRATLLSADEQLLNVVKGIRAQQQFDGLSIYSLIATSTELYLGGADDLLRKDWAERDLVRPLVVSLDEIDWLFEGQRLGKFQMVSALADFHARLADKPFALFAISQLRGEEKYALAPPEHLQEVMNSRIDRSIDRIMARTVR